MARRIISTEKAPGAIGPYSQGVVVPVGEMAFLSGQIPLNPATGELVAGDTATQARQVMENLKAVLEAGGFSFADVVKTTIFLTNLGDFAAVNEVYGQYFAEAPPARATVQVAALPKNVSVEIDCIAVRGTPKAGL